VLSEENYFEFYHHELIQRVLNLSGLMNLLVNQGVLSPLALNRAGLPGNFVEIVAEMREQIDAARWVFNPWLGELKELTDLLHTILLLEESIALLIEADKLINE
jgi:hypothetical protein